MSNVTLTIGGRSFTVATAEGQEGHIESLGRMIDGKLASMQEQNWQSESRMLLFAALLLADELHEKLTRAGNGDEWIGDDAGRRLSDIAARLENLAGSLESATAGA